MGGCLCRNLILSFHGHLHRRHYHQSHLHCVTITYVIIVIITSVITDIIIVTITSVISVTVITDVTVVLAVVITPSFPASHSNYSVAPSSCLRLIPASVGVIYRSLPDPPSTFPSLSHPCSTPPSRSLAQLSSLRSSARPLIRPSVRPSVRGSRASNLFFCYHFVFLYFYSFIFHQ